MDELIQKIISAGNFTPQLLPFIQKMAHHIDQNQRPIPERVILDFATLFHQLQLNPQGKIDWRYLEYLSNADMVHYEDLTQNDLYHKLGETLLSKTVILKLNGGLGTSMGLYYAKSKIIVDTESNRSFLDFIKCHADRLNQQYKAHVALWFLNSFNTQKDTREILQSNLDDPHHYFEILQNKFPKIEIYLNATGAPIHLPFEYSENPHLEWNPAGHGDIYRCLSMNDSIEKLVQDGKKYMFISNSDNLGATLDLSILGYFQKHHLDFLMETTPKTPADIKGGTVIRYQKKLFLLEKSQVPEKHIQEFENFPIFNTNNIWINLESLLTQMKQTPFSLPLISNQKMIHNRTVIQLETAMGAAIQYFNQPKILVVPRNRFFPVKNDSDLMLIRSDYTLKKEDTIAINPLRLCPQKLPSIQLSSNLKTFQNYEHTIQSLPSLVNIDQLSLKGQILIPPQLKPVFEGIVCIESEDIPIEITGNIHLNNVSIVINSKGVFITSPVADSTLQVEQKQDSYRILGKRLDGESWSATLEFRDSNYVLVS